MINPNIAVRQIRLEQRNRVVPIDVSSDVYHIIIGPDLRSGPPQLMTLSLSMDRIIGIAMMVNFLFPTEQDRISIIAPTGHKIAPLDVVRENDQYILGTIDELPPPDELVLIPSWDDFIFENTGIKRTMRYSGVITGLLNDMMIQFDDVEFLLGLLDVIQWFRLPFLDLYIKYLHDNQHMVSIYRLLQI